MTAPKVQLRKLADLTKDPHNARTHSAGQIEQLADAIGRFGWTVPMLVDDVIRAGNGRYEAAQLIYGRGERIYLPPGKANGGKVLPDGTVPAIDCTGWSPDERKAYALADNQLALQAGWDERVLREQLDELQSTDWNLASLGFDDSALAALAKREAKAESASRQGNMAAEFLIAPFTVFNAREGWWQQRKKEWLGRGLKSELGRENVQSSLSSARSAQNGAGNVETWAVTSIFDPVLCEIAYRWFSPVGGTVLDPFAGGSVRGIVAQMLGRRYVGVDLRAVQIEANREQGLLLCPPDAQPEWHIGDSAVVVPQLQVEADMVFSCPPYGDLEVYSEQEGDISAMEHQAFVEAYRGIIAASVAKLRNDRFACFVVGDYRDKRGFYRDFVSTTIRAFEDAGARLYNEAILVTPVGSLPVRSSKQFRAARKLGKSHQNVLVFCKGDPKRATEACGDVDVSAAIERAAAGG